ncbi:MAG: THUMP domain-containing class I SAM-dependent RNA methyltransferase [Burkholderiales bacterium]
MSRSESYFATCPRGLENVLATELEPLGATDIAITEGGVGFQGDAQIAYRANLHSRVASRVLWSVFSGGYRNEDDIYHALRAFDWDRCFDVERTLRVNVSAIRSPLKSLDFLTLRIKDAVCDRFRDATGKRPNVDTASPDVRIHAFLTTGEFTVYLDSSGEALFKRGYRSDASDAPLRENLAAGIVKLSGWTAEQALLDPMCGGATLLIEAAHMALGVPPGANREFGFQKLKNYDPKLWKSVKDEAHPGHAPGALRLFGSDRSARALESARRNLGGAGLAEAVHLAQSDVLAVTPPAHSGVLVMNPPYGVRTEDRDRLAEFYPRLGDALKQRFAGWHAYIFTSDLRLPKLIGLSPSKRTPLFNGALECRLYEFRIVAGSMRKKREE